jgi:hypothetical protein
MAERELLDELFKTLSSNAHKEYVRSYIAGKGKDLSEKFDALVKAELSET